MSINPVSLGLARTALATNHTPTTAPTNGATRQADPQTMGKYTLLKLLVGQLRPDEGTIAYAQGVTTGYLPQIADFHPERTLHEEMLTVFDAVRGWERM